MWRGGEEDVVEEEEKVCCQTAYNGYLSRQKKIIFRQRIRPNQLILTNQAFLNKHIYHMTSLLVISIQEYSVDLQSLIRTDKDLSHKEIVN
jgi:hypothetical protein